MDCVDFFTSSQIEKVSKQRNLQFARIVHLRYKSIWRLTVEADPLQIRNFSEKICKKIPHE